MTATGLTDFLQNLNAPAQGSTLLRRATTPRSLGASHAQRTIRSAPEMFRGASFSNVSSTCLTQAGAVPALSGGVLLETGNHCRRCGLNRDGLVRDCRPWPVSRSAGVPCPRPPATPVTACARSLYSRRHCTATRAECTSYAYRFVRASIVPSTPHTVDEGVQECVRHALRLSQSFPPGASSTGSG